MKKNNLTVLFILFCYIVYSQSNTGIITYKKDLSEFYQNTAKKFGRYKKTNPKFFNDVMDMETKAFSLAKEVNFYLKFNKEEAIFKAENVLEIENDKSYGLVLGPLGRGVYYTNIKNNENITKLNAYGELFLIKSEPIHWQLTNETKKIGKYLCNKATTEIISKGKKGIVKHPITVWYAPAIPVHFGPLGYYGLPGLILKLEIYDIIYYASKIELNSTKTIKIKKPIHGKVVTKKEFDEIGSGTMKNFKKNFKNLH